MWRDDAYLLDILLAARKVQRFTQGLSKEAFEGNEVTQLAVVRLIQMIGEAARGVSPGFKTEHPEVPWRAIVGMRHRLVHDYLRVDLERVWQVVETDIGELIRLIEPLVPPESSGPQPPTSP